MYSSSSTLSKPDVTLSLTCPNPNSNGYSQHGDGQGGLKPEARGTELIQLLLTCAKHASSGNLHRADECLRHISQLSSVTGDSMQRLAAHFATALAIRLVKRWPGLYKALNHHHHQHQHQLMQNMDHPRPLSSRAFPYLGFSYVILARTLINVMADEVVIHIIDLGSCDPKLWIPLLRGFASSITMQNGPPHLKVTCVHTNKHVLHKLGRKLTKEAGAVDMPFQFNPINANLRDLNVEMLRVRPGEALALVSVLNLHVLLAEDDRVDAHFGAKKSDDGVKECKQMSQFLGMVRSMSPKVLFLVEREADHNLNRLGDRFVEGLHYYSAVFDAIDATSSGPQRLLLEQMVGREIENIVASEGLEREGRHERYAKWAVRFGQAGFKPVRLWFDQTEVAAEQMAKAVGREGFKVVNERASLMICWHDRPLYAVSAWIC